MAEGRAPPDTRRPAGEGVSEQLGASGGRSGVRAAQHCRTSSCITVLHMQRPASVLSPHPHATHLAPPTPVSLPVHLVAVVEKNKSKRKKERTNKPTPVSLPVHFVAGVAHQILNRNMPHIRGGAAKRVAVPVECVG